MGGRLIGKRIRHARSDGCGDGDRFEGLFESRDDLALLELANDDVRDSLELLLLLD